MLEVGPFPRRPPGRRVLPADVFTEGIPGAEGTWLLGGGISSSGVSVPTPGTPRIVVPAQAGDPIGVDLCFDPASAASVGITATSFDSSVYFTRVQHTCANILDDGSIKTELAHVRDLALNELLTAAVDGLAAASIASPGSSSQLAYADEAIALRTSAYGLVGLPGEMVSDEAASLMVEGDRLVTMLGNGVWVHSGTDVYATSEVFYATAEQDWVYLRDTANATVYTLDLYVVVAVGDLAATVAA